MLDAIAPFSTSKYRHILFVLGGTTRSPAHCALPTIPVLEAEEKKGCPKYNSNLI